MPRISRNALRQVRDALGQYEMQVDASPLALNTKNTYLLHARNFVRWLDDDFEPGATLRSGSSNGD